MDKFKYSVDDATTLTTLDANSGYWEIWMACTCRHLTTVTSHLCLYRFLYTPFGLQNAPATFHQIMNITLVTLRRQLAMVHIYDVIILSKTAADHSRHFNAVLQLFQRESVFLQLEKFKFFSDHVDYLCHSIFPRKLAITSKTFKSVNSFDV